MRPSIMTSPKLIVAFLLTAAYAFGADANSAQPKFVWPKQRTVDGTKMIMYQPQIESWENNKLQARAAIAFSPQDSNQLTYGVIFFSGQTDIDKEQRLVNFKNIEVTKVTCPNAPEKEQMIKTTLQKLMPENYSTSLDHLELSLAMSQAKTKAKSMPVKNDPPRIFYSTSPALLVLVDGDPAFKPDQAPGIKRVINTQPLLLFNEAEKSWYLRYSPNWANAPSLDGPWTRAKTVPPSITTALQHAIDANDADLLKNLSGDIGDAVAKDITPRFFVSTVPAELIVTKGEPNIQPLEGTSLLYVANTTSDILADSTGQFFFLISGRWFKAPAFSGPWTFVPGKDLPSDFMKIPPSHPIASVLASIPSTPQAKESVIANSIPQTATIKKSEAKFKPSFDGQPQFVPIEGTNIKYAKNSPVPIFDVPGNTFYALDNGIWFKAANLNDNWLVTDSVPAAIYSIPPSSPVYYATYVQEYGSTPDEAYFGYTPGYYGTVVEDDTVVYGTGYVYEPWIGSAWYGVPVTYGCGVEFGYNPAYGWTFDYDYRPLASPWFGPMAYGYNGVTVARYHWTGYDGWGGVNAANVYHRWPNGVVAGTGRVAWENPWTGNIGVARRGAVYNPATGRYAAGRGAVVYNPSTGQITAARQGISGSTNIGTNVAGHPAPADRFASQGNDVFADRSGQIYRSDAAGNFQRYDSGRWSGASADRDLAAQRDIRAQSAYRQSAAVGYRGAGGGGGGFRGGGRR